MKFVIEGEAQLTEVSLSGDNMAGPPIAQLNCPVDGTKYAKSEVF
jgi:hypothetical protein